MKIFVCLVIALSVVTGYAPGLKAQCPSNCGPYNTNQNPYWPMATYDRWIFQSTDPSNNAPTVISVQPGIESFGCLSIPNTNGELDIPAYEPWQIEITKIDPRSYWAATATYSLQWMLGVQPSGQPFTGYAGALYGFGWFTTNYWSTPSFVGTADVINTANEPAYLLLEPNGSTGSFKSTTQGLLGSSSETAACLTGTPSADSWSVIWTDTTTDTPAYSGAVLSACYTEVNTLTYSECWYFAKNIGPVAIVVSSPANEATSMRLVSYPGQPGGYSPTTPSVTLYDAIVAQASYLGPYTFAQWGPYFTAATGLAAPTAAEACVPSVDQNQPMYLNPYLSYLELIGTANCTAVQYQPAGINTTLQQMESMAGTTTGLDYFQWSYYYTAVTGKSAPAATSVCMPTVYASGSGVNMQPDAVTLLDGRQWLLYFEHAQGWPACGS